MFNSWMTIYVKSFLVIIIYASNHKFNYLIIITDCIIVICLLKSNIVVCVFILIFYKKNQFYPCLTSGFLCSKRIFPIFSSYFRKKNIFMDIKIISGSFKSNNFNDKIYLI